MECNLKAKYQALDGETTVKQSDMEETLDEQTRASVAEFESIAEQLCSSKFKQQLIDEALQQQQES
jgi:hypothetical protein